VRAGLQQIWDTVCFGVACCATVSVVVFRCGLLSLHSRQPATPLGNSAPLWRGFFVRASSCAVQPTLRPGVVKVGLLTFLPPGETASPRKHEDLRTNLAPPLGGAFVWAPSPLRRMPRRDSAGLRSLFLRTHRVLAPSGLTIQALFVSPVVAYGLIRQGPALS
jgi:hypothetical protein